MESRLKNYTIGNFSVGSLKHMVMIILSMLKQLCVPAWVLPEQVLCFSITFLSLTWRHLGHLANLSWNWHSVNRCWWCLDISTTCYKTNISIYKFNTTLFYAVSNECLHEFLILYSSSLSKDIIDLFTLQKWTDWISKCDVIKWNEPHVGPGSKWAL